MATLQSFVKSVVLFPHSRWHIALPGVARMYQQNSPIPHIFLPNFLEKETARSIAEEFPDPDSAAWTHYQHPNENKLGMAKRERFPQELGAVVDELNSPGFVTWLSELTGIAGLMADPMLEGGAGCTSLAAADFSTFTPTFPIITITSIGAGG